MTARPKHAAGGGPPLHANTRGGIDWAADSEEVEEMLLLRAAQLAKIAEWILAHGPIPACCIHATNNGFVVGRYEVRLMEGCVGNVQVAAAGLVHPNEETVREWMRKRYPEHVEVYTTHGEPNGFDVERILDWIRARERASEGG